MPNMSPKKAPMPTQEPNVRNKNFLAVSYTHLDVYKRQLLYCYFMNIL